MRSSTLGVFPQGALLDRRQQSPRDQETVYVNFDAQLVPAVPPGVVTATSSAPADRAGNPAQEDARGGASVRAPSDRGHPVPVRTRFGLHALPVLTPGIAPSAQMIFS
jgi:hypothetical protein